MASDASTLLVASHPDLEGEIVGMLCLTIYRVLTGIRAIVEDVAVLENFRNRGIAQLLLNRAIELARTAGADALSLTSNPNRVAANQLY